MKYKYGPKVPNIMELKQDVYKEHINKEHEKDREIYGKKAFEKAKGKKEPVISVEHEKLEQSSLHKGLSHRSFRKSGSSQAGINS
jgi:hypothetical protein